MLCIHTMEYYSALPYAMAQMNLENIMLNEASQSQKDNYCMIHSTYMSYVSKVVNRSIKYNSGSQWRGKGGNGQLFNGYKFSVMQDEEVLDICCGTNCIQLTLYYTHLRFS